VRILLILAVPAVAAAAEEGGGHQMLFRVVNFLILAGGLAYLISKHAPAFFAARGEEIRRAIAEGRDWLKRSQERAAAVDQRVSRLSQEIAELSARAREEMAAEHARLERETEEKVGKVFVQAEQEIAAAAKAARLELKAHAASLAVGLAEQRIAGRLNAEIQRGLVEEFVRGLNA
jgi:F-type H+-transporting ATPase subunit b